MNDVSPLVRAALIVADLDRSFDFYSDVLGYEELFFDAELQDRVINELLAVPSTSYTRVKILKATGPSFGMVGLFEITEPAPPGIERSYDGCHVGEVCMVFYCADVEVVYGKLQRHSATIVAAPRLLNIKEIPGAGQREMVCRGPDGELLNFIERDPADALRESLS